MPLPMDVPTKAVTMLGGYVTAHIALFRNFQGDYDVISIRSQILDSLDLDPESTAYKITYGYVSRYADCMVYTQSLDFQDDLPEHLIGFKAFWEMAQMGGDPVHLWQAFSKVPNAIVLDNQGDDTEYQRLVENMLRFRDDEDKLQTLLTLGRAKLERGQFINWTRALDIAQVLWKPRDEKMTQDGDNDFLSQATNENSNS
jgi:hypothetical protein